MVQQWSSQGMFWRQNVWDYYYHNLPVLLHVHMVTSYVTVVSEAYHSRVNVLVLECLGTINYHNLYIDII